MKKAKVTRKNGMITTDFGNGFVLMYPVHPKRNYDKVSDKQIIAEDTEFVGGYLGRLNNVARKFIS